MKRVVFCLLSFVCLLSFSQMSYGQVKSVNDSIGKSVRKYAARNFSQARTFNLYWNSSLNHDYTLKRDGKVLEDGRIKNVQTLGLAVTLPIIIKKKISIYTNGRYNYYQFDAYSNQTKQKSEYFTKNSSGYSFYEVSLAGSYRFLIDNKPVMLMGYILGDGWNNRFEKVSGSLSAVVLLKKSSTTSMSIGLYGTTLFDKIPAFPIFVYSHLFTPNFNVDMTLPSQAYFRYQFRNSQRFSIGTSLSSEHFYMSSNITNLPKTTYFRKTLIKPELVYEYIIDKHFYLNARAGVYKVISGGIYKTNRKKLNDGYEIKYKEPLTPYVSVGCSYNIF